MNILPTTLPDVKLLQPQVHGDERGFFMETFRDNWFREHIARAPSCRKTTPNPAKASCAACTTKPKTPKVNSCV